MLFKKPEIKYKINKDKGKEFTSEFPENGTIKKDRSEDEINSIVIGRRNINN